MLTGSILNLYSVIAPSPPNLKVDHMAEYYVSPTGNDSKGTGTLAKPWKTITKGVASMNAGDLLYHNLKTLMNH
jgi:hypothetical protein